MRKIFITGGTGFIGSHLCALLADQGHELTLLLRKRERPCIAGRPAIPFAAKIILGDLLQLDSYVDAMQGCDAVIHLAADYRVGLPNKVSERKKMYDTNVLGTQAVAQAVMQAKVPRLIYADTTAAFGESNGLYPNETHLHNGIFRSYYEETKHIAHRLLEHRRDTQNLPVVMAILGGVFGEGDTASVTATMRDFLNKKLPVLPDSQSRFQLCHVSHVCEAFSLLLEHSSPDPSYLFTGQDFSMQEIITTLAHISGIAQPKKIALNTLKLPAKAMDALSRFGLQFPLSEEVLHVLDGSTYMYSSAKAQAELGWSAGDPKQELENHMRYLMNA